VLPRTQVAEVAVELVVGVLADAARVEHDDVGVVLRLGADEPVGLEQAGDAFRVVLVHLAPVGAHDIAAGHARQGYLPPTSTERVKFSHAFAARSSRVRSPRGTVEGWSRSSTT